MLSQSPPCVRMSELVDGEKVWLNSRTVIGRVNESGEYVLLTRSGKGFTELIRFTSLKALRTFIMKFTNAVGELGQTVSEEPVSLNTRALDDIAGVLNSCESWLEES